MSSRRTLETKAGGRGKQKKAANKVRSPQIAVFQRGGGEQILRD